MRDVGTNILAQLNQRTGITVRNLFWITAKNRSTGAAETMGIWNGPDTQNFTISGDSRTYVGGGGFMNFDDLKQETGLLIHRLKAVCSPVAPEMDEVIRTYDAKFARVEVHLAFFSPGTETMLDAPERVFKGWIDTIDHKTPRKNESGAITINMVGNSRILTRRAADKRSDQSQKLRSASDDFFKYVSMTGNIKTPWGSK